LCTGSRSRSTSCVRGAPFVTSVANGGFWRRLAPLTLCLLLLLQGCRPSGSPRPAGPPDWRIQPLASALSQVATAGERPWVVISSRQLEAMWLFFYWVEGVEPPSTPVGTSARALIRSFDGSSNGGSLRAECAVLRAECAKFGAAGLLPPEFLRLGLRLGEPPQLDLLYPVTEEERRKVQVPGAAARDYWVTMRDWHVERYVSLFRSFYAGANVESFFAKHSEEYSRAVDAVAEALSKVELPSVIGDYLGVAPLPLVVVVSALAGDHRGWESTMTDAYGRSVAVVCIGVPDESYSSDTINDSLRSALLSLVAHEFIHPHVDRLFAASGDDARNGQLYEAATRALSAHERLAYPGWNSYWNETVVKALGRRVNLKILKSLYPDSQAGELERQQDKWVAQEVMRGWVYVPTVIDKLKEYETSSEDFAAFYPRLLELVPPVSE